MCVSGGTEGYVGAKQNWPWQQRRKRTGAPKGQTASGAGRARPSNVIYVWRPLAKLWSACAATCIGENPNRGHGMRGGVPLRRGGREWGRAVSPMTRGHAPPPIKGRPEVGTGVFTGVCAVRECGIVSVQMRCRERRVLGASACVAWYKEEVEWGMEDPARSCW